MKTGKKGKDLVILLVILLLSTSSLAFSAQDQLGMKDSALEKLRASFTNKTFSLTMKPLAIEVSTKDIKTRKKPGFIQKSKNTLHEKNSPGKSEKPVYIRYLLPVMITLGAGTATYMLYSVRSN